MFVAPTQASIAAAAQAEVPVASDKPAGTITAVDFAGFPSNAYPLTTTIYAAVNITNTTLDQSTRNQYATLIDYAIGAGQTPGTALGELPVGYAPLDAGQVAQAQQLSDILTGKLDPNPGSSDSGSSSGYTPPTESVPVGTSGPSSVVDTAASDTADASYDTAAPKQPASTTPVGGAALGGSLLAGVAGAIAAPLLMRRKVVVP